MNTTARVIVLALLIAFGVWAARNAFLWTLTADARRFELQHARCQSFGVHLQNGSIMVLPPNCGEADATVWVKTQVKQ